MSEKATYRLCSLIHHSLLPFTEHNKLNCLTKEKEKHLLISLSQVVKKIRGWINDDFVEEQQILHSHSSDHDCLTNILANLISLLNVSSRYVQHLVGNLFLAVSEFLVTFEGDWGNFINLLCVCFEFALRNALQHYSQPSVNEAENSNSIPSNLNGVLINSSWNVAAAILRILRGIVKLVNMEYDSELRGTLLNPVTELLSQVPSEILSGESGTDVKTCSRLNTALLMNEWEIDAKILLLGNLVQLLCSFVDLAGSTEDGVCSLDISAVHHKICDLVPRILQCCLAEEWIQKYRRVLTYFQHKILMLMIRLSSHMQLDCSILLLWLRLLHECYEELLLRPISQLDCAQDDALEGSPFLLSLYDQEVCHLSSRHLQRKAIFLFIRCSLSLNGLTKSAGWRCACTRTNSFHKSDSNTIEDCFAKKKGLLKFYGWLQGHVSSNMLSENEIYLERCVTFASSFIRLYMHEDDLLFEVLLLMFSIPSPAETLERRDSCDTEESILLHMSNVFNPLLLFHVFLAELQYDHQLLLDCLISKDTGSKCAEYLLRCLRIVCESWKTFLEIPVGEALVCEGSCQSSCKRSKVSLENTSDSCIVTPLQSGLDWSSEQDRKEQKLESQIFGNRSLRFENAKACLLCLKGALRKLHRRKLFPYNPEVLIRRLAIFEELCDQSV